MLTIKKILHSTALAAAISLAAASALPAAAAVTVGNNDSGNCYPFSCFPSDNGTTYQQIYSATAFSGITSFNQISFFGHSEYLGLPMDTASYRITFSTSSKAVNGLSGVGSENVGADSQLFSIVNVSGNMPSVLSFTGATFTYDPSLGNLLMQVDVLTPLPLGQYQSFFQADYTGTDTQRYYAYNGSPEGTVGNGALRTEFSNVSAVPEPETYAMMIAGLALLGFAARRRKQKTA